MNDQVHPNPLPPPLLTPAYTHTPVLFFPFTSLIESCIQLIPLCVPCLFSPPPSLVGLFSFFPRPVKIKYQSVRQGAIKIKKNTYAIVEGLDGTQETRLVVLAGSVGDMGAHEAGNRGGDSGSAVKADSRGQRAIL